MLAVSVSGLAFVVHQGMRLSQYPGPAVSKRSLDGVRIDALSSEMWPLHREGTTWFRLAEDLLMRNVSNIPTLDTLFVLKRTRGRNWYSFDQTVDDRPR